MVGLLVFDSILVFFDAFYFTHKVIIIYLLFYGTEIIYFASTSHNIYSLSLSFSLLVLNFKFTCVETRERAYVTY